MAYLKRVTSLDRDIEDKMNYFINRFLHMAENSGSEAEFDLETPLSIFQKIHFLLENESRADFRIKYCDIYFLHPLIEDCYLWKNYPDFEPIKVIIDQYLSSVADKRFSTIKDRKQSLIETQEFRRDLVTLINKLKEGLPETLHKFFIAVLVCQQSLREHDHPSKLSFLARMYVSGAYYSGKTTKEIRDVISRIFDASEERFPFPEHARTKRLRLKLMRESVMNTQIAAFQELLYDNRKFGMVVMRLYGGNFPSDFSFTYDRVRFLGQQHPYIERLKSDTKEEVHDFFTDARPGECNYIFICTNVSSFTHSSVRLTMRHLAANAMKYLESLLKRDFVLDPTDNYLITNRAWKNKGGHWSFAKYETPLTEFDLGGLQDNPFRYLRGRRNLSAVEWCLSREPQLVDARRSGSAQDYWTYLESLFKYPGSSLKVEKVLADILILNVQLCRKRRVLTTLMHGFDIFSGGAELLQIPYEKLSQLNRLLRRGVIPGDIKKYDSLFVQEIVQQHESAIDSDFLVLTRAYYHRSIMEVYGLRNFQVHRGITNPGARVKTEHTIPFMTTRLRWLIFAELKENQHETFGALLDVLYEKGKNLIAIT